VDLHLRRPRGDPGSPVVDGRLRPIPGRPTDPTPRQVPRPVQRLESRPGRVATLAGAGYRTAVRFSHSRATLLAAGTTYYLFLALLSVVTLAYGLTALLGTQWLAAYVTEAVASAFPGVIGENSLDVQALRSTGQAASIVSAVGLLYGATGAVLAASRSVHFIYGAAKDPRPFVLARLRAGVWLVALAPLILLSYVGSTILSTLSERLLALLGIDWHGPRVLLLVAAGALTILLDFLVVVLILANLGGIRPARTALLWGATLGAIATEALKLVMAVLLGYVVARPQYGALAAPIGVMFVLFLQSLALLGAASLTAAIAEGGGGPTDPVPAERATVPA
jgi:uncharacterized BrkB/YihY/UPF0761 family membrane protein